MQVHDDHVADPSGGLELVGRTDRSIEDSYEVDFENDGDEQDDDEDFDDAFEDDYDEVLFAEEEEED